MLEAYVTGEGLDRGLTTGNAALCIHQPCGPNSVTNRVAPGLPRIGERDLRGFSEAAS